MANRKIVKHCDGCHQDLGARWRTLADCYLCERCYKIWTKTGTLPKAQMPDDDEETAGHTGNW